MRKTAALITIFTLFFLGTLFLLHTRLKKGESFPEYSSLRADPVGTKVLFESLRRIKHLNVTRNYQSLQKVTYTESTIFFINIDPGDLTARNLFTDQIDTLLRRENRVVISFGKCLSSQNIAGSFHSEKKESTAFNPGIRFECESVRKSEVTDSANVFRGMNWPGSLQLYPDSTWKVLVSRESCMVLGEKKVYGGELIVINNGYNLSNQGLRENSRAIQSNPLISYCIGSSSTVIFDEWHHGIVKRMGVSALIQKFGFIPVIVFLMLWFLLLVWHINGINSKISEPRTVRPDESEADTLLLLLTSKIPPAKLDENCRQEWQESFAERILPPETGKNLIEKYNSLYKQLTKKIL
jgi:hypothetical protein